MEEARTLPVSMGARLRRARELAFISQAEAAQWAGIHRPTLSLLESGRQTLPAELLLRLSWLYRTDPTWVLFGYLLRNDWITVPHWPETMPRPAGCRPLPLRMICSLEIHAVSSPQARAWLARQVPATPST